MREGLGRNRHASKKTRILPFAESSSPKRLEPLARLPHRTVLGPLAGRAVMLRFAWLLAGASAVTQTFYVCNDAGDLDFRGSYDLDEDTHANKPTWTNAQGKTIFAHGPFWYIGDLSPHPVETLSLIHI